MNQYAQDAHHIDDDSIGAFPDNSLANYRMKKMMMLWSSFVKLKSVHKEIGRSRAARRL